MKKYYLFKGTAKMEQLQALIGESVFHGSLSFIGRSYELHEEQGHLVLMSNNAVIARTSAIAEKTSFSGAVQDAPVTRTLKSGLVSATEMLVYRTVSGSVYAFVPVTATLQYVR